MCKGKNWDIPLDSDENVNAVINDEESISTNKTKKRIPIYVRLIISVLIYCIIYTILNFSFPNFANYINQIVCFVLAMLSFIFTSYKDHKNKLYNEIYGRGN